jgi:hypothetical protein
MVSKSRRVRIKINRQIEVIFLKLNEIGRPLLIDYQQTMAQWIDEARAEKLRIADQAETNLEPCTGEMHISAPEVAGLLTPPWIEYLLPEFYLLEDGEIEGIIHINTSDVFGIVSIYVTLRDEAGNLLEEGDAMPDETWVGYWIYLPRTAPAVGTSVMVRAAAADALGGMSIARETVTLTEEYLRTSTDEMERWKNR